MKRFIKPAVAASLLAMSVQSFAAQSNNTKDANVSPAERAKIEAVVHDYLLQKPEVLVQALQILQQKQMEETKQTIQETQKVASSFAKDLFDQSSTTTAGNPNGKVTVVEFFDYQCPHCVDMAPVMEAIIKANPNVRVVYKDFPIRGPASELAAKAAIAAGMQGKYSELSHAILTANQPITEDSIMRLAKDNGLDVEKLKKDMNSPAVDKQIKSNMQLAKNLKLFGTPALFVANTSTSKPDNISYIPGYADQKQLQNFIDQANK